MSHKSQAEQDIQFRLLKMGDRSVPRYTFYHFIAWLFSSFRKASLLMDRADIALKLNGDHPIISFLFIRSIIIRCILHFNVTILIFILATFGALLSFDLRHNGSSRHFESALAFHQVVTESTLVHSSVGKNNGSSPFSLAADPRTFVLLPLGICRDTFTFHGIFAPHPVVAESIGRMEDTLTVSLSLVPKAGVG